MCIPAFLIYTEVTFEQTRYQTTPARFGAGTGNIADAVGLATALDYVEKIGLEAINCYEHDLLQYATQALEVIPGLRLIGTALNKEGITVRSGHHCAQPILRRFGLESTVRPSLAFYNTYEEIDVLVSALNKIQRS